MKNRRKKFAVYPPDYKPMDGNYKKATSWRKAKLLAQNFGVGAEIHVQQFERHRDGAISFWNVSDVLTLSA